MGKGGKGYNRASKEAAARRAAEQRERDRAAGFLLDGDPPNAADAAAARAAEEERVAAAAQRYQESLLDELPRDEFKHEVSLPAGQLGIAFERGSTTIANVRTSSPLRGLLNIGETVVAFQGPDVDCRGMTDTEISRLLADFQDGRGRRIVVATPAGGQREILLPPGRLGIRFKRRTTVIEEVLEMSALEGMLHAGMVVVAFRRPARNCREMTDVQLAQLLVKHQGADGRRVVVQHVSAIVEDVVVGNASVGGCGCCVAVEEVSVAAEAVSVETRAALHVAAEAREELEVLEVDWMTGTELASLLGQVKDTPGRRLVVGRRGARRELKLPPGTLGVKFSDRSTNIIEFRADSVLRGCFYKDDAIVGFACPELEVFHVRGMSDVELVTLLNHHKETPGRRIVVNDFWGRKSLIDLPTGSLGIVFKAGSTKIDFLRETSPLAGYRIKRSQGGLAGYTTLASQGAGHTVVELVCPRAVIETL